ncbi:MAG: hypothetical protein ACK6CO_07310 [Cyanobacteriota bacterium]
MRSSNVGGRQRRLWLARALALALVLLFFFTPSAAQALSWRLPGRATPPPPRSGNGLAQQRLQEVPPPDGVQRLQVALEDRDPQVRILAPADGSLLPDGPWSLRLQVSDWPLVDAGPLGMGPHLVVQLDGQPPRPVVATEVEMPPLSPGSHLLTVYAAKPWGEAHKGPSALQQIRVHRLAVNPATLPPPGTSQLIPVSPVGPSGAPPLLLDWLLIDAPLQGLRTEALGWRLRVTLNGESVLLDRQIPVWLKGWQPGSNALLWELLDGRGEPLNPPFNSLLQEVIVPPAAAIDQPRFGALTAQEMAVLLGEKPASVLLPAPADALPPGDVPLPESQPALSPPQPIPPPQDALEEESPLPDSPPPPPPVADRTDASDSPEVNAASLPRSEEERVERAEPPPGPPMASEPEPEPEPEPVPEPEPEPEPKPTPQPETETAPMAPASQLSGPTVSVRPAPAEAPEGPSTGGELPPETPSQPLTARQEVNPDGTLKRQPQPSPLQRLRERLKR